jgi:hypothetical protein
VLPADQKILPGAASDQPWPVYGFVNVSWAPPPTATTGVATDVTATDATLNGTINPQGHFTYYHFEWGTSGAYDHRTPAIDASAGADSANHAVSAHITGLAPGTTYHFRIVALGQAGRTAGLDRRFTTPLPPPGYPTISITSPSDGSVWVQTTPHFAADARDSDGTALTDPQQVRWRDDWSDPTGAHGTIDPFGTGTSFDRTPQGFGCTGISTTNVITATATNAAGNSASYRITIHAGGIC